MDLLSGIYKGVYSPKKKVTSFINLVVTVIETTWENISKISPIIRSACSKDLESWFDGRLEKPIKNILGD